MTTASSGEEGGEGEGGGVGVTMKKGERLVGGDSFGSDK